MRSIRSSLPAVAGMAFVLASAPFSAQSPAGETISARAEDWSRFRGPNGTGIVPDAGYPTEFGPSRNLKWRSAVRPGKSSPVLSRRHVFLTAYDEGALYTQCFDRETGRLVWERLEAPARHEDAHVLNEPSAVDAGHRRRERLRLLPRLRRRLLRRGRRGALEEADGPVRQPRGRRRVADHRRRRR